MSMVGVLAICVLASLTAPWPCALALPSTSRMAPAGARHDPREPQQSLRSYQLTRIEIVGLHKVPRAEVLRIAQLRPNTLVRQRDVESATARLIDSGLFTAASHRYRMEGYGLVVIFVLEELAWATPVFFDNFLGYPDEELKAVIAARFPLFDGHAPERPAILDKMAAAVQARVRKEQPAATVSYIPVGTTPLRGRHYRFRLELPAGRIPICRVDVDGLPPQLAAEADDRVKILVGMDYSRAFLEEFAVRNVLPIAQREGHYQARLVSTSASHASSRGPCLAGPAASIVVDRGAAYTWDAVEWAGATALTGPDRDALQRVAIGRPADHELLDQTVDAAVQWYRRRGYMEAQVTPVVQVIEDRRVIVCRLSVGEGPRYRLRSVAVAGLDEAAASRVRRRWTAVEGDFYDGAYTRQFTGEVRALEAEALKGRTIITIREKADRAAAAVDVVLEFAANGT